MFPTFSVIWSFALIVGLLTITPGLDTALILRTAAVAGRGRAWGVVLGIQSGTLIWGGLTAVGVTALLTASHLAYEALRITGAVYLVWIGGRILWSAVRGAHVQSPEIVVSVGGLFAGLRQGLTTNLLNPKMGAFYVALLPQFIPSSAPHLLWGLALASTHVLIGIIWSSAILLTARAFKRWLARRRVARTIDGVAGAAIAGFGIRLAISN